ncbi:hypothetical protein ACVWYS_002180 [Arthrobacter sp. TE12231]
MAFNLADHPRDAAGRFITATHAAPAVALGLTEEQVHARRLDGARYVLEEYADLEIPNHSPARQDTVRLDELGDPALALGNCWAATNELIEAAGAAGVDVDRVDEITISRRRLGGRHVAILAADQDGMFVIDYTARQFHPDLPYPLVAGVEDWRAAITKASGTAWALDD